MNRVLLPVVLASVLGGCSTPVAPATPPAPPEVAVEEPTSPATRTCPEPAVTHQGVASKMSDRELVPLSESLFGVESSYGSDDRGFMLVSGGYLDDVLEAYDELHKFREVEVRGVSADVLVGTFVEPNDTRVAIWREPLEPPCDAHALVAWNLTAKQFRRVLDGLR